MNGAEDGNLELKGLRRPVATFNVVQSPDRGLGRACAGQQVRLASAVIQTSPDPVGAGDRDRALGAGVLGRLCRGGADAAVAAPAGYPARLATAVCRRNPRPGARPRSRTDQDRLLLVDC